MYNTLNKKATAIFNKLIEMADANEGYIKFDNSDGTYLPVSVERLGVENEVTKQAIYAIGHWYEQNGDLIPDPDMTFLRVDKNTVIVKSYRDYYGVQQGEARFANIWLNNINKQQSLKVTVKREKKENDINYMINKVIKTLRDRGLENTNENFSLVANELFKKTA